MSPTSCWRRSEVLPWSFSTGHARPKSTLAQALAQGPHAASYVTLDDATALSAAASDATGFVGCLPEPVVVDEVQRAPDLFLAIKAELDRRRTPGRFLLIGSANVWLLPTLAESLAGRMEVVTLWPLSRLWGQGRPFPFEFPSPPVQPDPPGGVVDGVAKCAAPRPAAEEKQIEKNVP